MDLGRDGGSKFYFALLKRKVAMDTVLSLHHTNGSLAEDPSEIQGIFLFSFSIHFAPYDLTGTGHLVENTKLLLHCFKFFIWRSATVVH